MPDRPIPPRPSLEYDWKQGEPLSKLFAEASPRPWSDCDTITRVFVAPSTLELSRGSIPRSSVSRLPGHRAGSEAVQEGLHEMGVADSE